MFHASIFGMSFTFNNEVNLIVQHITGSAKSSWHVSVTTRLNLEGQVATV